MPSYHQLIEAIRMLLLAHDIGEPDTLARAIKHARDLLKKAQNWGRRRCNDWGHLACGAMPLFAAIVCALQLAGGWRRLGRADYPPPLFLFEQKEWKQP